MVAVRQLPVMTVMEPEIQQVILLMLMPQMMITIFRLAPMD